MLHRPVNLDFTHQLLLSPASLQGRLLNNLGSCDSFVIALNKLVALCESSLAQELAFDVLPIGHFSILMFHFFFNYLSALILS